MSFNMYMLNESRNSHILSSSDIVYGALIVSLTVTFKDLKDNLSRYGSKMKDVQLKLSE